MQANDFSWQTLYYKSSTFMFESVRFSRRELSLATLGFFTLGRSLCCARNQDSERILCASAHSGLPSPDLILRTTGNAQLDQILSAELNEQSRFFGLKPAFLLYSGSNRNAFATSESLLNGTQGTILYNLPFLGDQLRSTHWGGAVVAGIIAHEFGHIYQFFTAYAKRLDGLHKTVKFHELHADFLSGFYMAQKFIISKVDLKDYYDTFYDLGDYKFDTIDHHGTKQERYFAIKAGHNLALRNETQSVAFAAAQGELFLREYIR